MNDLQKVILSIYKEIKIICERHNIDYYAIGGTCIGAVRHKGFIPWDDDLDVAIPIEQIQSFIEACNRELPPNLYLYTSEDHRHYRYVFLKVCDNRTTFIEKSEFGQKDAYKGVFVDIMPIAGIPSNHFQKKLFLKKIRLLNFLNIHIRYCDEPFNNNFSHNLLKIIFRTIYYFIPYSYFSKSYLKLLNLYPFHGSQLVGYVWWPDGLNDRLIFPYTWFLKKTELPFEDTFINLPQDYDNMLKQQFGDYMTPPSVGEQESHEGLVNLDKSYKDQII